MRQKKRGQITVFIIIGLVLLLSVGVFLYIYQQRTTAPIKRVIAVPEDAQQIYDYVQTCTDQITKDGLIIMGAQAGYIYIPPVIDRNHNAYVNLDPLGAAKTPMWYYEGEDRTPSLDFMQRELAVYVKQNLPTCVNDFVSFADRYKVTPKSDILPVVLFTDSEVIVELKWQLEIEVQGRLTQLTEFITSFPVKLKTMHELAQKTMEAENQQGWFENLTIDLMSANNKIPVSGMEFSCGTKKWHITEVKKQVQTMLYYNLPFIRIENTQYPPPLASIRTYNNLKDEAQDIREALTAEEEPDWPENPPADVYEMNRMRWDVGAKRTDLKATFTYQPDWPLLINAQPSQGGLLSTAQMKGARKYLRFLCLNQWHFAYDLIYPVKMTIRDDTAFYGEGYNFQMAFPVIIKDNEESRKFFGLRKFQVPDEGIDQCNTIGTQTADIRVIGFEEGIPVAIELENANITYTCVTQECQLGTTYNDGTGIIRLNTILPEGCGNPLITAKKQGYLEGKAYVQQGTTEIMLTQLKKLNYTIEVHPYFEDVDKENPMKIKSSRWYPRPAYNTFTKTMHATVSLSLRNRTYDQYKTYPASAEAFTATYQFEDLSGVDTDTLEFVLEAAQYDIDVLLFKGEQIIGGYHAENLTITYDELARSNNVILNVVEYAPVPVNTEDPGMFLFLYDRGKYLDETPYANALKPEFVP